MNLRGRKEQEEFFRDYLSKALPHGGVRFIASKYDADWSEISYQTPEGPLAVRVNEAEEAADEIAHRTGFVARLLAEGGGAAEAFLQKDKSLTAPAAARFDRPVTAPGLAGVFAWDATGKLWPKPFYVRRRVDGSNLAMSPNKPYFKRAGALLRRFHAVRFGKYYPGFKAAGEGRFSPDAALLSLEKKIAAVEKLLSPVTARGLLGLPREAKGLEIGLLHNRFFGGDVLIDDAGTPCVPDWEKAGIGDLAQDFFPLKYWTVVDEKSGWYAPDADLFDVFCAGYGEAAFDALAARPVFRALEAQWLLRRLETAAAHWAAGTLREPYPEPEFYIESLERLLDV